MFLCGKLIVFALDWEGAVKKASRALEEFYIDGIKTNIPLHQAIAMDEDFKEGNFNTTYLEKKLKNFSLEAENLLEAEQKKVEKLSKIVKQMTQNNIFTMPGEEEVLY